MEDLPRHTASATERRTTASTLVWLLLIIAIAAALRFYHLDRQSLYWDDVNGIAGVDAPSLPMSLVTSLGANKYSVPVYYIIQYYWGRCFGTAPETIRCLSVLIGILTIPGIYLLGRGTLGRTAALIGCFCFACSPEHIFRGQEPRHYTLLVLCAVYAFLSLHNGLAGGGRGWFVANLVFSSLVIWTHAFGCFLIVCEGIYLLFFIRGRTTRAAVWFGTCALQAVLLALWIHFIPHPDDSVYAGHRVPGLQAMFSNMFAQDAISMFQPFPESFSTWPIFPQSWGQWLAGPRERVGVLLEYGMLAGVMFVLAIVIRRLWRRAMGQQTDEPLPGVAGYLLVLAYFAFPPVLLAILSYAWRPIFESRFMIYCSVGLYLLVGAAIGHLSRRPLRIGATVVLVAAYAYMVSLVVPNPTRLNWIGASDYVWNNASSSDLMLVGGQGSAYFNMAILAKNKPDSHFPIMPAHTLQAVCDKTVCFLTEGTAMHPGETLNVWFIIDQIAGQVSLFDLDACLSARGLLFEKRFFSTQGDLCVYRIRPRSVPYVPVLHAPDVQTAVDYDQLIERTGIIFPGEEEKRAAVAALRRVYDDGDLPPNSDPISDTSELLLQEGFTELVLQDAEMHVQRDPADNAAMILALFDKGDMERLETELVRYAAANPGDPLVPVLRAYGCVLAGDGAGAQKEIAILRQSLDMGCWHLADFLDALSRNDMAALRKLGWNAFFQAGPIVPKALREKLGITYTPCGGSN